MTFKRLTAGVMAACSMCYATAAAPGEDAVSDESRKIAAAITVNVHGEESGVAELGKEPALRFGDPARDNGHGTLWIWTHGGRPVSLMEMYFNTQTRSRIQVVASLTRSKLDVSGGDGFAWRPMKDGIEFQAFDASPPAETPNLRLRQMKSLARRFRAHQFWDPNHSRYELRLMPQPVLRYTPEQEDVTDGAVFLLAHGTNPEIALLIEAEDSLQGKRWRFGAARIGHAEMHLALDDKEVWRTDRLDVTEPDAPYHLFYYNAPGP
jgi:hypothetical protein